MPITLRNKTRRLLTLNLPHALVPEQATMAVVGTRAHDGSAVSGPKDASRPTAGSRWLVAKKGPVSGSVTLLAKGDPSGGDYARGLPRSVLTAPDVVGALRRGDVEVTDGAPAASADLVPDEKPAQKMTVKPAEKKPAAKVE